MAYIIRVGALALCKCIVCILGLYSEIGCRRYLHAEFGFSQFYESFSLKLINTFHMYSSYIMLVGPDLFRHFEVSCIPCGASDQYCPLHTHHLHLTPLRTPYQTVIFRPIDVKNGFYTQQLVYTTLHGSRDGLYHPCGCPRIM